MERMTAVLAAMLIAVYSIQAITASSVESFNNLDDSMRFPSSSWYDTTDYYTPYESPFVNDWDYGSYKPNMDVGDMVDDIMHEVNAGQPDVFSPDFSQTLQNSIEKTIHDSMESMEDMQDKIVMETKKIQDRTNAEQSKMINGDDGITLLEIEANSQQKKQYIIQDGKWFTCKDTLSTSESPNCSSGLVDAKPDVCAFNSIVKYNVNLEPNSSFKDSNLVCLIKGNANSVRQFSGVPEKTVHDTCVKGDILTMKDYNDQCGEELKVSYNYWTKDKKACDGNGHCTMTIDWKVSAKGISQNTSSGPGSSDSNNFSVVSSSVSSINKK